MPLRLVGLTLIQAKKKWCPFYRPSSPDLHDSREGKCLANDCVFWEWQKPEGSGPLLHGVCGMTTK